MLKTNVILNGKILRTLLRSGMRKKERLAISTSTQYCTIGPGHCNKARKIGIKIGKNRHHILSQYDWE